MRGVKLATMKCPVCPSSTLVLSERQGIEIDYCPTCRGVWLDRGELDKLIERAAAPAAPSATTAPPPARRHDESSGRFPAQGGYRKKSWLGELFD